MCCSAFDSSPTWPSIRWYLGKRARNRGRAAGSGYSTGGDNGGKKETRARAQKHLHTPTHTAPRPSLSQGLRTHARTHARTHPPHTHPGSLVSQLELSLRGRHIKQVHANECLLKRPFGLRLFTLIGSGAGAGAGLQVALARDLTGAARVHGADFGGGCQAGHMRLRLPHREWAQKFSRCSLRPSRHVRTSSCRAHCESRRCCLTSLWCLTSPSLASSSPRRRHVRPARPAARDARACLPPGGGTHRAARVWNPPLLGFALA